jgi:hypothetical protein
MTKANLKWGSQKKDRGWDGLNDAAINAFNSNVINSFVREMFQNSNDARDKELSVNQQTGKKPPLHISINYKTFKQEQFPNFEEFIDIFRRIKSAEANNQHVEFFKHGEKAMGMRTAIKFFVYEDFNTTGLSGDDKNPTSTFSSCVLSEGTSVKPDDTAGGSYGIGKNAIFGFSKLRTVFYSSLSNKGEYIFQGVTKLASYNDSNGNTYERRIFCGNGEDLKSVRNFSELPEKFQDVFKRTLPGLSQYAACPLDNLDWLEQFTKAILRNYWLLLYNGSLVVELKAEDELILKIEESNLEDLLLKYYDPNNYKPDKTIEPGGNPYEFYKCLVENNFKERTIDKIGMVKFYYRELTHNTTNRVAYMRNNMVVYSDSIWGFGSINYCGVFICEDKEGNKILRMMEPPTHDSFKPERLTDKTGKYSAKDGEKILWDIEALINEALQEISDKYKKAAEDIPWLDELLSSLTGAAGNGSGNRTNIESDKETPERMGAKIKATVSFSSLTRNTLVYDPSGVIPGGGVKPRKPGPPKPVPPKPPGPGRKPGPNPTKQTRIESRIFKTNQTKKKDGIEYFGYKMFLDSKQPMGNTDILISQKGDSGNVVCFEISEVLDSHGNGIQFSKVTNSNGDTTAFKIKSVPIPSELIVHLSEPYKSSFKIVKS